MELSLSVIIAIAVILIVLKFAKQIASKLLGLMLVTAVVIGIMYHKSWGPFKENVADIAYLTTQYCVDSKDPDICDCIVKTAQRDLEKRFTSEELDSLSEQRVKAAYVLKKSLAATKDQAMLCLGTKGVPEKYGTFLKDFVPIENKYLDMAEGKVDDVKGRLKDEFNAFKENKKSIDDKY
jgi:hypothetical protein